MKKVNIYFVILGLGIGIMISGLAFKMYPAPKAELTDQEIIERARVLGMVGIKEHIENKSAQEEQASQEKAESMEVKEQESTETSGEVSIAVNQGESSEVVADKLLSAKLIDDKKNFVSFVSEKNAGRSFRQGTYTIKAGASYDEILSILTKGAY